MNWQFVTNPPKCFTTNNFYPIDLLPKQKTCALKRCLIHSQIQSGPCVNKASSYSSVLIWRKQQMMCLEKITVIHRSSSLKYQTVLFMSLAIAEKLHVLFYCGVWYIISCYQFLLHNNSKFTGRYYWSCIAVEWIQDFKTFHEALQQVSM